MVSFYKDDSIYNPTTGEFTDGSSMVTKLYCNVTDSSKIRSNQNDMGVLDTQGKTIRTSQPLDFQWDYLVVGDDTRHYGLQNTTNFPLRTTIVVGEVLGND